MVSNKLSFDDVQKKAKTLDFPGSVIEFFQGMMGQPYAGFPEPLRSDVLRGRKGLTERPGKSLEPLDLVQIKKDIHAKHGSVTECDVASYAMYPKVFEEYKEFVESYGDLSVLPTKYFLAKPTVGEEFHVELGKCGAGCRVARLTIRRAGQGSDPEAAGRRAAQRGEGHA
jgi:pyruvate carboxylase